MDFRNRKHITDQYSVRISTIAFLLDIEHGEMCPDIYSQAGTPFKVVFYVSRKLMCPYGTVRNAVIESVLFQFASLFLLDFGCGHFGMKVVALVTQPEFDVVSRDGTVVEIHLIAPVADAGEIVGLVIVFAGSSGLCGAGKCVRPGVHLVFVVSYGRIAE